MAMKMLELGFSFTFTPAIQNTLRALEGRSDTNETVEGAAFTAPWPGSAKKCPRCHSERVAVGDLPAQIGSYGRTIAVCGACKIGWEPIDETLIWDWSDPVCSLSEPCSNCAFRPGSPEQADKVAWKALIASLREGRSFYCHKGVPLAPGSENGFDYPMKPITAELAGVKVDTTVPDTSRLRLCRGYLNALGTWWKRDLPAEDDVDEMASERAGI